MKDERDAEKNVWPPPPQTEEADWEPEPNAPPVTDQTVGHLSLGLSGLGSLCALAGILISAIDPHKSLDALLDLLMIGSAACFVAGFFVGIVGWFSWKGKVGISLGLIGPLWLVVGFAVDAYFGP